MIRQAATQGDYTLITYYDEVGDNPRREWDNFGRMICWHRRYDLGDNHNYNDPEDFMRSILSELDIGKTLFRMLKQNKFESLRIAYDRSRRVWVLESYGDFCKKWYEEETYAPGLNENELPCHFQDDALKRLSGSEMNDILNCRHDVVMLPLYLYDHSGITMSVSSFSCTWDSGMFGWIYADRTMIEKEYGAVNTETVKKARKRLIAEVETYDLYLTGQCYGYSCYEGECEIEGCGGYLGEYDNFVKDLRTELPEQFKPLADELTDCLAPDIANYFWRLRHAG